jgi:Tol biopolymer transport system component
MHPTRVVRPEAIVVRFVAALAVAALVAACSLTAPPTAVGPATPTTALAPSSAPSGKKTSPPSGRIVFSRIVFGSAGDASADLFVIDARGGEPGQLTDTPDVLEIFPAWSSDGRAIAYTKGPTEAEGDIWVVGADGSGARRLTDEPGLEAAAAWSPDGTRIAYAVDWTSRPTIWIRDATSDGPPVRVAEGNWPSWTPDGTRLLITTPGDFADARLAYINLDGSGLEVLPIDLPNASEGAVASTGAIAFVSSVSDYANSDPSTWNEDIYTVGADGSRAAIRLTNTLENDHWPPSWSPDGTWLAYTHDLGQVDGGAAGRIAILSGTMEPIYLTDGKAYDAFPSWGPEGPP